MGPCLDTQRPRREENTGIFKIQFFNYVGGSTFQKSNKYLIPLTIATPVGQTECVVYPRTCGLPSNQIRPMKQGQDLDMECADVESIDYAE